MLIAWDNKADDATLSASSELASLPGSNVQYAHLSRKWYTAAGVNSASLLFDMLAAVSCGILAVLGTNLTSAATMRLRGSDSDPTGATGEQYDSGSIAAAVKAGYGAIYHSFASASARYWLLELEDTSLSQLQAGRVFLGPKWTPTWNQGFGWSMLARDDSQLVKSFGGQVYAEERPQQRVIEFTLGFMDEAEMYGNAFALARSNGIVRDVLAVNDTSGASYRSDQSVWGLCTASEPIVHETVNIYRQKFRIEERL